MNIKFLKANCGDCILISFRDPNNQVRNILIDGGTNATYFDEETGLDGELKFEIDGIKSKNQKIDLLILTHIDNDHVCGLLQWLQMDQDAAKLIETVWFNSGRIIADYFRDKEINKSGIQVSVLGSTITGPREAIDFDDYLKSYGIKNQGIILAGQVYDLFGATIRILTPTEAHLKDILALFKGLIKDDEGNPYTAGKGDWAIDLDTLIIDEQSRKKITEDPSPTNKSSITFVLTVNERSFLFLADGQPRAIAEALMQSGFSEENPIAVDLVKLSHHGSHLNTTKKLLKLIKTDTYILSTDGTMHGHPHKGTVARILAFNPNAKILFNYDQIINAILTPKDKISNLYNFGAAIYSQE